MHQIQLTDEVYEFALQLANKAGHSSVDDYIAEIIIEDELVASQNHDHLFTPERLEHVKQVYAKVKAGGETYTIDEVRQNLAKHREDWIKENSK